jgi:type I restriction enzyme S subunit
MISSVAQTFPKAFSVSFSALNRWDPNSFHDIHWHWPSSVMAPIGSVLKPRKEKVDRSANNFFDLMPVTIHFNGSIEPRKISENKEYSMELFWARPGDIVASKIDLKNGAVAIIPNNWNKAVVTNHFAVYEPNIERLDQKYFHLLIQANFFKQHLWRNKVGAEGRKEVKLNFFESLEIPVPPLPLQQKIVTYWESAVAEAIRLEDKSKATIDNSLSTFIVELGLSMPKYQKSDKLIIRQWKDFDRWSVDYNQAASTIMDLTKGKFPVVELGTILDLVQYGTSEKTNSNGEGVCVIRMNNIVDGDLDISNLKHLKVSKDIEESLKLISGDILINRTNSKELVGKCAVFDKKETYIFASYLIRLRVDPEKADPHFVAFAINGPIGRLQINALSRQIIGQANINSQEIRSLKLPLPNLNVQQKLIKKAMQERQKAATLRTAAKELLEKATVGVEQTLLGTRPVENI